MSDDRVELVDDNVGIRYRLRKCGKTRLVIIAVVVAFLVIGGIVAAAYLLTSKFSSSRTVWGLRASKNL